MACLVRVSSGPGVLCAEVRGVRADGACAVLVKASFVEPAPGQSVMFRSKQVVHETAVRELASGGANDMHDCFELDVQPPPEGADWADVEGDLLFTVFDRTKAGRNVFVGQVLVPLHTLVDLDPQTCRARGGSQRARSQVHPLCARDGSLLAGPGGELALSLRLELPPEEPLTPRESKTRDERTIAKRQARRKPAGAKSSRRPIAKLQHERMVRSRQQRTRAIEKENAAMQQRIQAARHATPAREQNPAPPKARSRQHLRERRGGARDDKVAERARQLLDRRDQLEREIPELRAAVAREEVLLRRHDAMLRRMNEAEQQSRSREVVRSAQGRGGAKAKAKAWATSGSTDRRPRSGSNRSCGSNPGKLNALKAKTIRLLERHLRLCDQVKTLEASRDAALQEAAALEAERADILVSTERAATRRRASKALLLGQPEGGQLEGDNVLAIEKRTRETRVEIAVARTALEEQRAAHAQSKRALQEQVAALRSKCERKRAKLAQEEAGSKL